MLRALLRSTVRALFGCRHRMQRARRTRFGCAVLHYVCEDCGHAVPIIERTEAETRKLFTNRTPLTERGPDAAD